MPASVCGRYDKAPLFWGNQRRFRYPAIVLDDVLIIACQLTSGRKGSRINEKTMPQPALTAFGTLLHGAWRREILKHKYPEFRVGCFVEVDRAILKLGLRE